MNTTNDAAMMRHNGAMTHSTGSSMKSFISQGAAFMQLARDMAESDIIPKDFRGKPANVFLAIEMAHRLGLGTMEVMQNLYVVHGTPSLSSKFLIGLANRSGRFRGGLRFEVTGDGERMAVRCYATDRETAEELEVTVTMAQAKRAGWTKNSKYVEMPEQMCSYRAATFFVRRYCPEVMLGMMTVDEANELPRSVAIEPVSDPLDAILTPTLDKPDDTAHALKEPLQVEATKKPAPQYAPKKDVDKLVKRFEELGVPFEEFAESFGPLDKMTPRTFQEAIEHGRAMAAKQTKAQPATHAGEMFDAGDHVSGYDQEGA